MLPIGDENPTRIKPIVNWTLIAICIIVFIWQTSGSLYFYQYTVYNYGIIPSMDILGVRLYTFLTNMFLHTSWSHLLGNMVFLWIFGDNIEDCCGHLRYLGFYFLSGIIASLFWVATEWGSMIPAVGASGAISGVLGAYYILYPNALVKTLIGFGFFFRVMRVRANIMIGLWFVYQLLLAFVSGFSNVAYWAHIGGFIGGLILAYLLKPRFRKPEPEKYDEYRYYDLDDWR